MSSATTTALILMLLFYGALLTKVNLPRFAVTVCPSFGSPPFASRTKVNSFGGTVGPVGALPGPAPGAGGGALGSGGSTIPWPPRKVSFNYPATTEIYGLPLHDALPI